MATLNFNSKLAVKLLGETLVHHYAGFDNAVMDGDMTQEEFDKELHYDVVLATAQMYFDEAMKTGYFDSPMSDLVVEAKHIKFQGKEVMEMMPTLAFVQVAMQWVVTPAEVAK